MIKTYKEAEEAGEIKSSNLDKAGRATDFQPVRPFKHRKVMRPRKTSKDKESGAWAQHNTNKSAQAQYNSEHKERVRKTVYNRRK